MTTDATLDGAEIDFAAVEAEADAEAEVLRGEQRKLALLALRGDADVASRLAEVDAELDRLARRAEHARLASAGGREEAERLEREARQYERKKLRLRVARAREGRDKGVENAVASVVAAVGPIRIAIAEGAKLAALSSEAGEPQPVDVVRELEWRIGPVLHDLGFRRVLSQYEIPRPVLAAPTAKAQDPDGGGKSVADLFD